MIILDRLLKKTGSQTPLWVMRQAGRYLPEYQKIRANFPDFMELCYNVDSATEVTLQPISRFDLDAAIIFSDILTIPDALGQSVRFEKDHGPTLGHFRLKYVHDINEAVLKAHLSPVYEAISKTRNLLSKEKALYGFAGSPWTLSCYMVEEGKSSDFKDIIKFSRCFEYHELLETLIHAVSIHLSEQISAGADVVQIFDSWAMVCPLECVDDFIVQPFIKIAERLYHQHPATPIVYYSRCNHEIYLKIAKAAKEHLPKAHIALGVWQGEDIKSIANATKFPTQGNLDPEVLIRGGIELEEKTQELLEKMKGYPHVFNLGHGIDKTTPIENMHKLIDCVRGFGA